MRSHLGSTRLLITGMAFPLFRCTCAAKPMNLSRPPPPLRACALGPAFAAAACSSFIEIDPFLDLSSLWPTSTCFNTRSSGGAIRSRRLVTRVAAPLLLAEVERFDYVGGFSFAAHTTIFPPRTGRDESCSSPT